MTACGAALKGLSVKTPVVAEDITARQLDVRGIVQGVGFRPFVFQLAETCGLQGRVANTASGVAIHLEGRPPDLDLFCRALENKPPPLARIMEIKVRTVPVEKLAGFSILPSRASSRRAALIAPDVAVCDDCRNELFDPENRRYRYPFINCTNCGPRYTIIADIPYDRAGTSMQSFDMCPACQAEYDDPGDRRFHAQPNACPQCGPRVSLYDRCRTALDTPDPVRTAAELLRAGCIVAVKGLGGFHLAADATSDAAVAELRKRKPREEKPFALMAYDLPQVEAFARTSPAQKVLLTGIERPIVLLEKKKSHTLSALVAPRNRYFGVMLPYTPLHYLLLETGFAALVMTSGNRSEEPIIADNDEAFARLADIADYFLIHDRDIYQRSDDSIVCRAAGATRFVRRSRGYVPVPVFLKTRVRPIIACGGELKNTICLTRGKAAFLSQHIGDLENRAALDSLAMTATHLKRILDIRPEIVACDLHPDYLSTRYAEAQTELPLVRVQHHHAHVVSCMAENRIDGTVIGLAFDGTGYGLDGSIWGGEVLAVRTDGFERAAHLAGVPMPGGAAAIREPWRMGISYLHDALGDGFRDLNLPFLTGLAEQKIRIVLQMIAGGINSPETSSLGRLFDGIAAIAGIRSTACFEGQAAMELEMTAVGMADRGYGYDWDSAAVHRILPGPIVRGVVRDIRRGVPAARIGAKFHRTLVNLLTDLCAVLRKERGLDRVVLTGGVFQNSILLTGLQRSLKAIKFKVFTHRQVPPNDGGLSLGQALVANAMAASGSLSALPDPPGAAAYTESAHGSGHDRGNGAYGAGIL